MSSQMEISERCVADLLSTIDTRLFHLAMNNMSHRIVLLGFLLLASCTFRDTRYFLVNGTESPISVRLERHWNQTSSSSRLHVVRPCESVRLGRGNYLVVSSHGQTRSFIISSSHVTVVPVRAKDSTLMARLRSQSVTTLHVINDGRRIVPKVEANADQDRQLPAFGIPPVFEPFEGGDESASRERLQVWIADQITTVQEVAIRRWMKIEQAKVSKNEPTRQPMGDVVRR